jgi:hypothetical protein
MAVIDAELAAFMQGPVMIVAATRDAARRPTACRMSGLIAAGGDEQFRGFLSASLWPQAMANLQPGWPIAVTFAHPGDYRAFQVKGSVVAVAPATPAEMARAEAYVADTYRTLSRLGSSPRQIASWLTIENLHSVTVAASAAYRQTPGPGAGLALEPAGAR